MPAPSSPSPARSDRAAVPDWALSYVPRSVHAAAWELISAFVVASVVESGPGNPRIGRCWLTCTSQYVAWCVAEHHPLTRQVVWQPDLIELWVDTRRGHCKQSTRLTIRSALRHIGRTLMPQLWPHPPSSDPRRRVRPPYTDTEMARLLRAAESLPTETLRWKGLGVIAAGAGAGCGTPDMRRLRGTDIRRCPDGAVEVTIAGPRPRVVICLDRYADLLLAAAERAGDGFVSGGDEATRRTVSKKLPEYMLQRGQVRLEVSRLRTTWITALLSARVPFDAICAAAAIHKLNSLEDLLPYITPTNDDVVRGLIRGA